MFLQNYYKLEKHALYLSNIIQFQVTIFKRSFLLWLPKINKAQ